MGNENSMCSCFDKDAETEKERAMNRSSLMNPLQSRQFNKQLSGSGGRDSAARINF